MPLKSYGRGLGYFRPQIIQRKEAISMPWREAFYVLTKAFSDYPNSKLHPNSGDPNYDVSHAVANISDIDTSYLKIDGSNANAAVNIGSYNLVNLGGSVLTGYLNVLYNVDSNLIPYTDSNRDLGSLTLKWQNLHLNSNAYIGTTTISPASIVDSTGEIDFGDENLTTSGILFMEGSTSGRARITAPAVANFPTLTLPTESGVLSTTTDLDDYVPYTGATSNVDLGSRNLTTTGTTTNRRQFSSSVISANVVDAQRLEARGALLSLQQNAEGNIACFESGTISDTADGNYFYVYRNAAEGKDNINIFVDAARVAKLQGSSHFALKAGLNSSILLDCGGTFSFRDVDAGSATRATLASATGNFEVRGTSGSTAGFKAGTLSGVSGTFTTADTPAKTVTVTSGVITSIV